VQNFIVQRTIVCYERRKSAAQELIMPSLVGNPVANREQQIADLAYRLWEEEGNPEGRADAHWLRAATLVDEVVQDKPKLKLVASGKGRRKAS
jgi:Protein of unknown function (DUF2934)